ncbi:MAG: type III CRISPR-associated RAMP protein Csx7, partial [Blastocatellia bacterium]
MFDRFDSRVIVRGGIVAETGLHIGSGATLLDPSATDSPVIRDAAGRPFIPGSSFKGALRAHLERLLRGLRIESLPACDPLANPCLPEAPRRDAPQDGVPETLAEIKIRLKNEKGPDAYDEFLTWEVWKRSCAICRLFGSNALAARLMIRDLFVDMDSWVGRTELRDGVGIDRDTETARQSIKYDFEVVPATTRFKLEMALENGSLDIAPPPGAEEASAVRPDFAFGLLAVGLRELEKGRVALGGKTTRGLGKISFDLEEIEVIGDDPAQLLDYLITGEGRRLDKA